MDKYGLVSNYTIKQFKVHKSACNEDKIANEVDRKFNSRDYLEVGYLYPVQFKASHSAK